MSVSREKILEIVKRKSDEAVAEIVALADEPTDEEPSAEIEALKAEVESLKVSLQERTAELDSAKALLAEVNADAKALDEKIPD